MSIIIKELSSRKDLRKFIYLPEKIHKNHKNWLHPLYSDEWIFFDKKKNKAFNYSDTILALAYKDGKLVGRVMGIINKRYNEMHNEKNGRFGFLECYEDKEVFNSLLKFVEDWAKSKGMNKLIGPMGFSDDEPQGFLIEGYEEFTVMITNHSFPFMIDYIEANKYVKRIDLVQYRVDLTVPIPPIFEKVAERIYSKGFKLIEFKNRKEIRPWIHPVLQLTNDTYGHIYGYVPFEGEEMDDFANRYLPILDPEFLKIMINAEGELVGYAVGIPNLTKGISKAKGRLWPFGFIHVLLSMKKSKQIDMLLGAVKENYRGRGIDNAMGSAIIKSANKRKMTRMDSHHVMELNTPMRAGYEKLASKIYKRYRIFERDL